MWMQLNLIIGANNTIFQWWLCMHAGMCIGCLRAKFILTAGLTFPCAKENLTMCMCYVDNHMVAMETDNNWLTNQPPWIPCSRVIAQKREETPSIHDYIGKHPKKPHKIESALQLVMGHVSGHYSGIQIYLVYIRAIVLHVFWPKRGSPLLFWS